MQEIRLHTCNVGLVILCSYHLINDTQLTLIAYMQRWTGKILCIYHMMNDTQLTLIAYVHRSIGDRHPLYLCHRGCDTQLILFPLSQPGIHNTKDTSVFSLLTVTLACIPLWQNGRHVAGTITKQTVKTSSKGQFINLFL